MRINRVGMDFLLIIVAVFTATILTSSAKAENTITVEITNFEFKPPVVEVQAGDSVIFINRDIVPHTATANDKSWDTGLIAKDESRTVEIVSDMSLDYFCLYHPKMKGLFSYLK